MKALTLCLTILFMVNAQAGEITPRPVKTIVIPSTEIETEFYTSYQRFFNPDNITQNDGIHKGEDYDRFLEEGLNHDNIEKYLSGDFEGNGGHPALAIIKDMKEQMEEALKVTDEVAYEKFLLTKNRIKVICSPVPLRSHGGFVIAKNFPHPINPTVYFDCERFMHFEADDQRLLVYHEILPILGVYDLHYKNSKKLVEASINLN
ncbi:MAG: hypothetical protein VXV96_12730 [Bdellovibrionota bacterium]|nr:hypothetical protein [Bdellovibrionota bacterium]